MRYQCATTSKLTSETRPVVVGYGREASRLVGRWRPRHRTACVRHSCMQTRATCRCSHRQMEFLIASFLFSRQGVVAPAAGNLEFLTGLICLVVDGLDFAGGVGVGKRDRTNKGPLLGPEGPVFLGSGLIKHPSTPPTHQASINASRQPMKC